MIYENEIRPAQVPVTRVSSDGAELNIAAATFPRPFHIGLQYDKSFPFPHLFRHFHKHL